MKDTAYRTIQVKYVFNYDINRIWNFIKCINSHQFIFKSFYDSPEITFGHSSWEPGAEFSFVSRNGKRYSMRVNDVYVNDDLCKISWKTINDEANQQDIIEIAYELHNVTLENKTLLIWDVTYNNNSNVNENDIIEDTNTRKSVCEKLNEYIMSPMCEVKQYEACFIPKNIELIWSYITNWNKLKEVVPFIAENVEYNGDSLKTETIMKLTQPDDSFTIYKVDEVEINNDQDTYLYIMECIDANPTVPPQKIEFNLQRTSQATCFVKFIHHFSQNVETETLIALGNEKKKILGLLRDNAN